MSEPLTREEFLRMARGDDPTRKLLWNGPPRITTPPQRPIKPMENEGQIFEFLFPYPINIFDDADWPVLSIRRDDFHIYLLKPLTLNVAPQQPVAAGNESADLFVTNLRVLVERTASRYPVTHADVFPLVREAMQWTRVLSRQYWIGTGTAGVAAAYRGSVFRVEPPVVAQMNYAGYRQTIQVRTLRLDTWQQAGKCVEAQIPVPAAESIFCDALSSFAAGDPVRCVIELGVSAEIEITNLLDDIAALTPTAGGTKRYLKMRQQRKDYFRTKLLILSKDFGLDDPLTYQAAKMPPNWAELVQELYNFRNKAAHEGRCLMEDRTTGASRPLKSGELQSFIFSVETLFAWAREQRHQRGLSTVATARQGDQVVSIIGGIEEGGGFSMDTSESYAKI